MLFWHYLDWIVEVNVLAKFDQKVEVVLESVMGVEMVAATVVAIVIAILT